MMQFQGFKPEAMNRIAKALGHEGDMGGFQDFLEKNPEKKDMMEGFNKKAVQMMQGGYVKGYAPGGFIDPTIDKFGPGMVDPRIPNFNDGQLRFPNQIVDVQENSAPSTIETDTPTTSVFRFLNSSTSVLNPMISVGQTNVKSNG